MRFGGKRRRCGEPYSVASQCDKMNSHPTVVMWGVVCRVEGTKLWWGTRF
jgi:hypothetical protein